MFSIINKLNILQFKIANYTTLLKKSKHKLALKKGTVYKKYEQKRNYHSLTILLFFKNE